jgi:hypothetical protein
MNKTISERVDRMVGALMQDVYSGRCCVHCGIQFGTDGHDCRAQLNIVRLWPGDYLKADRAMLGDKDYVVRDGRRVLVSRVNGMACVPDVTVDPGSSFSATDWQPFDAARMATARAALEEACATDALAVP